MNRYACTITYGYDEGILDSLLVLAFPVMGFEPKYISVFFDEFESPLDDVAFDEKQLISIFKKRPGSITVKSQLYDDIGDTYWFRMRLSSGDVPGIRTFSMEWSNYNLDFLLSSAQFNSLLDTERLLNCYCYDQDDCMKQSETDIRRFLVNYPDVKYKTLNDHLGDQIIDVSEHWGKCISTRGLMFIAAPMMWFGKEFEEIISEKELSKFKYSLRKKSESQLIYIQLFELYSPPSNQDNRKKQKDFWDFFKLEKRIKAYEEKYRFDFVALLKSRAAAKAAKRKKIK